jgi:hypothetical protein
MDDQAIMPTLPRILIITYEIIGTIIWVRVLIASIFNICLHHIAAMFAHKYAYISNVRRHLSYW